MLFRRNKTYQKEESSQAKKSLFERLVILDADSMESPEEVAEKLQEDPTVDARVVRVRSFAPERSMARIPEEQMIDMSDIKPPKEEPKEEIKIPNRPLHIERFEDAVSEIDEDESEEESGVEKETEDVVEGIESIRLSINDPSDESVSDARKFFDILERAREQEQQVEERSKAEKQVRIIYRVPKRAYGDSASRNAIHNELIERINNSIDAGPREEVEIPQAFEFASAQEASRSFEAEQVETEPQEVVETPDIMEEIRAVVGNDVSDEHVQEIIESSIGDAVQSGELQQGVVSEGLEDDEAVQRPRWIVSVEDAPDMPRMDHFNKVLFPEEYFYATDGTVIKTVDQLREALANMHIDTYNHHAVARGTNDFANWIEGVYGHQELAQRMKAAQKRDELVKILEMYL